MSAREFYYWVAFDKENPISDFRSDLHAAQITAAVYQSQGAKIKMSDCILTFTEDKPDDEPMDIGQAFANLINKKLEK